MFRLRYRVFNLELEEGFAESHQTRQDMDAFDASCIHLVVEDRSSAMPIGTYRLQTRVMADAGSGFYAATEFDLSSLPPDLLDRALEIGRACIDQEHRSLQVLYLLWQGLGAFVSLNGIQHVFGCCSLTSQDPNEATRVYRKLAADGHLDPMLRVRPLPTHACLVRAPAPGPAPVPRLMRAYLSLGARICSEPAIDRHFGTIDYLAMFDSAGMARSRMAFFNLDR